MRNSLALELQQGNYNLPITEGGIARQDQLMVINENSIAEIHYFPGPAALKHLQNVVPKFASEEQPASANDRYCIYNQSRQRFVSTDVVAASGSSGIVEALLRSVGPGSGAALWVFPYHEISPTSVRFPLDLVFLSVDCVVLKTVESFPLCGAQFSFAHAATMLVFLTDTLAPGEIVPGDQLMISPPEEMKRQLKRLQMTQESESCSIGAGSLQGARLSTNPPPQANSGIEFQSVSEPAANVDCAAPDAARESLAAAASFSEPALPPGIPIEQNDAQRPCARNWFQRLLLGDSPERSAPRIVIPGLIAYFFTGGTPMPQEVRDISTSGLYIITSERYFLGTVIRLTLSERHNPKTDRSLTVNAGVARWGDDGMGLEFLLDGDNRLQGIHIGPDHRTDRVDINRIRRFIETLQAA